LKTVETAKSDARDASRVVQVEARLRAELGTLRAERNDALAEAAESKRKAELLDDEVRTMKTKLSRVVQEKIKMERDSRAAISLARSLDSHASSDSDFYKRKVRCLLLFVYDIKAI
jgi:predicted ribosome quality control (RQC) complex YloA/Tae2 family protein